VATDKEFDAITDKVPFVRIDRLGALQRRAMLMLKNRTEGEIREAASTIEWLTSEYFYTERESWITQQIETGGSILRFLDYEERTAGGLRDLIKHPSSNIDADEFDFPSEENTRPLEALEGGLKGFDLDDQSFPNAKAYEYIAVLALVLISQAIQSFNSDDWPRFLRDDLPLMRLSAIANDSVDIMEVVCRAEQFQDQHEARKRIEFFLQYNEKQIPSQVDELVKKKVSLAASIAANARHKETSQSKIAALLCWETTGANFSSRAAFARNKHKEYGITERTLYGWIAAHERLRKI
jgi:hypothetical protein